MKKFNMMIITAIMTITSSMYTQSILGDGPSTYRPITYSFKPAPKFSGDNFTGMYIQNSQTAIINDASGSLLYSFHNVQTSPAAGLILIGTYTPAPTSNGKVSSNAFVLKKLYGQLDSSMVGTDSSTYTPRSAIGASSVAPVVFIPAEQFSGNGLVGNYFVRSASATIHDPSSINPVNYTFYNVTEDTSTQAPEGFVLIGSYYQATDPNTFSQIQTNLFGQLQE